MGRSMGLELSSGLIIPSTLESSIIIIYTEKVCIRGLMGESMKESGVIIKCMGKELSLGQMDENM